MKVFIRSSEANSKSPTVLAVYPADSDVPANAHGAEARMFDVPAAAVLPGKAVEGEMPVIATLVADWRERAAAGRSHLASVHELLGYVLNYGTDTSKWPPDAKTRKSEIEAQWPNKISE